MPMKIPICSVESTPYDKNKKSFFDLTSIRPGSNININIKSNVEK